MAEWDTAYINDLPDSAFACPDTRKYPHHNAAGNLDLPHLRNALSRVAQDDTETCGVAHLRAHAKKTGVGDSSKMAVKFVDGSDREIRGLALPFGGPFAGKDIQGEDFGADTDFCMDWFPNGRPILYHHGLNGAVKTAVVGRQTDVEMEDDGGFVKGELDKRSRYYSRVKELIDQGALGFSSGAMPHLVKTRKDGHIERWPWVELSLTPTPANPAAVVYAVKADPTSFFEDSEEDGSEPEPFDAEAHRVSGAVKAFLERAEARVEARAKAGRGPSASNREVLGALYADLDPFPALRERVRVLLEQIDPDAQKAIQALETELLVTDLRLAGVDV